jgi:hypothetical protein
MTKISKILSALALVAMSAPVVLAQTGTDGGSPIGGGAGLGASVAPLGMPGGVGPGGGGGNALSGTGASGLASARGAFMNAGAAGLTIANPMGGTVTVPQAQAQALGGVLGGNPSAAQTSTLTTALAGIPAGQAGNLVRALAAFGGNSNHGTLTAATAAFNAAVNALPANAPVPPGLVAIRQALAAAAQR